jgi:TPP-dependent pyruvate/acetoin dehydrogenase alpha subunit
VADASAAARNSGAGNAVSEFLDYAKETPAQRMRDAILKSMGLSEDDLKNMSPEKRKAVEETIRQKIKDAAEEAANKGKTGLVADIKV